MIPPWSQRRGRWVQWTLAVAALLLVAGCASRPQDEARSDTATADRTDPAVTKPAVASSPREAATNHSTRPANAKPVTRPRSATVDTLVRVTDGDTIVLADLGRTRLIGVDTPEVFGAQECYGREASNFTKRLLRPATRVRYRFDREHRDRYGRALAYVWKDRTFINAELVRQGYAVPLTIAPNVRHAERFRALAAQARDAGRGLWSASTCAGDDDRPAGERTTASPARQPARPPRRRSTPPATSPSGTGNGCDPSYAGACLDPTAADNDCAGGSGDGPMYTGEVRVLGEDRYDLDRDDDGVACEQR